MPLSKVHDTPEHKGSIDTSDYRNRFCRLRPALTAVLVKGTLGCQLWCGKRKIVVSERRGVNHPLVDVDLPVVYASCTQSAQGGQQGPSPIGERAPCSMATKTCAAHALWKWEASLDETLKAKLLTAAESCWNYARHSAWSYLHDATFADEILEESLEVVRSYALRTSPSPPVAKLTARLRSQIRRVAKQRAKRLREEPKGSLRELELFSRVDHPDPTDLLYLEEVLKLLSPQAKEVAGWIRTGYSWREIGKLSGIDHTAIRKAFRRETDAALAQLGIRASSD